MRPRVLRVSLSLAIPSLTLLLNGCSSSSPATGPSGTPDGGSGVRSDAKADATRDATRDGRAPDGKATSEASGPAMLVFDLGADASAPSGFYSTPFPSDLRLNSAGGPDYSGFPLVAGNTLLNATIPLASGRKGFSTLAVAYFQFTAPLAPLDGMTVIPAGKASNILLVDVDQTSPNRGTFYPTVAETLPADPYTDNLPNVVAVAAQPGFVLSPNRRYAFAIRREQRDANGNLLAVAPTLALLAQGKAPPGALGSAAATLFDAAFETLTQAGIMADDIAAATVFTTGDVVAATGEMTTKLVAEYPETITGLTVTPTTGDDAGSTYPRICELQGTITLPQFQTGTPPFASSGGTFQIGSDGLPIKQSDLAVPMAISIPTTGPMPATGYPLVLYFHGSGGVSTQFIDRGPILVPDGGNTPGQGPAYVLAPFGFAMAGAALPVNPQRVPNGGEYDYIEVTNLPSFIGNFQQGIIEQRIFLHALTQLTIEPSLLAAACPAVTVPEGQQNLLRHEPPLFAGPVDGGHVHAPHHRRGAELPRHGADGGGRLLDLLPHEQPVPPQRQRPPERRARAPRRAAVLPPPDVLAPRERDRADRPDRLGRAHLSKPTPGTTPRPIYEPVGQDDSYFSNPVYNAMAMSFGHREVGSVIWSSMQTDLSEEGLGGIVPYLHGTGRLRGARRRSLHRRRRAVRRGHHHRRRPPHRVPARRGQVPVRLLPLEHAADRGGARAGPGSARHAVPARRRRSVSHRSCALRGWSI